MWGLLVPQHRWHHSLLRHLTFFPLAAVLLPVGVGEGTFGEGHGNSFQHSRTQAGRERHRELLGRETSSACPEPLHPLSLHRGTCLPWAQHR